MARSCLDAVDVDTFLRMRAEGRLPGVPHRPDEVKLLSSDMWCGEALAKLQADGLLSAPMVIKLDNADESNYQVARYVSLQDLVRALVAETRPTVLPDLPLLPAMVALSAAGAAFAKKPLAALDAADDGELVFKGGVRGLPLLDLVRFALIPRVHRCAAACHRAAIFDGSGRVSDVISQLDVVAFVVSCVDGAGPAGAAGGAALPAALHKTLAQLDLARARCVAAAATRPPTQAPRECPLPRARAPGVQCAHGCVCMSADARTLDALRALVDLDISAVGIIEGKDGALLGCISASDLPRDDDWASLALPAAEYLARKHNLVSGGASPSGAAEPPTPDGDTAGSSASAAAVREAVAALRASHEVITVSANDTLARAMRLMAVHRIHRVFITDATGAAISLVTCTDALAALVRE